MKRIARQRVLSARLDRHSHLGWRPGSVVLAALPVILLFVSAQASPAEIDASPEDPRKLLERAFTNQHDVDTTATIELVIRNRSGQERSRTFQAA